MIPWTFLAYIAAHYVIESKRTQRDGALALDGTTGNNGSRCGTQSQRPPFRQRKRNVPKATLLSDQAPLKSPILPIADTAHQRVLVAVAGRGAGRLDGGGGHPCVPAAGLAALPRRGATVQPARPTSLGAAPLNFCPTGERFAAA
ncbi:hypothetical protein K0M31_012493 [Melipona bicolor]|uniref:Uncharacterized protein n=1 Tax=Melipona bicolor TaxID=60889 RepID=A0AA40FJZ4_9HYME|nr:hypothetical protein K0M31_012493 [Melipona bicolor]